MYAADSTYGLVARIPVKYASHLYHLEMMNIGQLLKSASTEFFDKNYVLAYTVLLNLNLAMFAGVYPAYSPHRGVVRCGIKDPDEMCKQKLCMFCQESTYI